MKFINYAIFPDLLQWLLNSFFNSLTAFSGRPILLIVKLVLLMIGLTKSKLINNTIPNTTSSAKFIESLCLFIMFHL